MLKNTKCQVELTSIECFTRVIVFYCIDSNINSVNAVTNDRFEKNDYYFNNQP